jgi:hypothetical protein
MPIPNYSGSTFVAFLDISGFQDIMKNEIEAVKALNYFYGTIFRLNKHFNRIKHRKMTRVRSLVVSDCAVIFVDNADLAEDKSRDLESILSFIQQINHDLISSEMRIATTCSIAYGSFGYSNKFEIEGIAKEFFIGWPYVNAFLDNEYGEPKIQPGQCRLLRKNLGFPVDFCVDKDRPLSLLKEDDRYYSFYWMLNNLDSLEQFEREYQAACLQNELLRYSCIKEILRKYSGASWNVLSVLR